MKIKKVFFIYLFTTLLFTACQPATKSRITVATAANMQFAMKALATDFSEKTGIACELVVSSSGKLTAQIREGAPYDVFVAANMKYPNTLYNDSLTLSSPDIYAYGELVLWSAAGNTRPTIDLLTAPGTEHIALANPKNAPYGTAAIEVLRHYGIWEKVKDKLVYGESIAQTNHFITSGAAEVGFTAMSVVLSPEMKGKGKWTEPGPKTYTPIAQGAVVIRRKNTDTRNAQRFYDYLFSPEAGKVLKDFGYLVDE
ncbi:molybdate ABC transporter substrate-binding protein [Sinomicrobium weinanense]|uniref:Molybdate ABC transporter substrate-binding protein n=1 Tax=Sinomicrobium weinanense TaxID=2842200 RepID=A0A926Q2R0_9FLAO|nr:molybdate ABC transporter substrate-binding protein [Sinomicrobium weinanense]MBC9796897.1 molybdate ABC transporter substrate-binding protein [Sinomicrobium weinanense]MBU3124205.1 molybdate ABC transporter substrate-binding protein [Sinomicrobium weinanense]